MGLKFFQKHLLTTVKTEKLSDSYVYKIPSIKVECNFHILKLLMDHSLSGDLFINMKERIPVICGCDDPVELMYYNRLFDTIVKIKHSSWEGFYPREYFPLLSYVKTRLPDFNLTVNVYDFLSEAGFAWETSALIDYSFHLGSKWELPTELIENLIEKISKSGYLSERSHINIIHFMIECCKNGYTDSIQRNVKRADFWTETREFYSRKYCQSIFTEINEYPVLSDLLQMFRNEEKWASRKLDFNVLRS
jgi:hypothetical protein